jgi:hypothetical protein
VFAMNVHKTGPVEIIPPDGQEHPYLTYRYANGVRMYHAGGHDITYKGPGGEISRKNHPDVPWPQMESYQGTGGLIGDFLHCVRTRQRPFRDVEIAHRACTVCHLGNLAYWLGRRLRWDPQKEQFLGDAEANRWIDRPKREPWTLA